MVKQRTIKSKITLSGIGVHSGHEVSINFKPASPDTGIVFLRTDIKPSVEIKALADQVTNTMMNTTLGSATEGIGTIEHLMSALAGLGIDNLYIEVDGPEIPIMDGSSAPFFELLAPEIAEQDALKKFIRVLKEVRIDVNEKYAILKPYDGFKIDFEIDFDHPVFDGMSKRQKLHFSSAVYRKEVSYARTFGFLSDYEWLRAKNLALGGSLANAVVLDENSILNEEGLRYDNEFVRHKILDAIGDLYMLGYTLIGEYIGYKSGHAINNQLVRALLADQSAWELISFKNEADLPVTFL